MPKKEKSEEVEGEEASKADTEKPKEERSPNASTSSTDTKPKLPFDLSKIDPAKIQMAEDAGIPIRGMLQWIMSTEGKLAAQGKALQLIIENMPNPKQIETAMRDAIHDFARQAPTTPTEGGQPGGQKQGGGSMENMFMKLMLSEGGGGSNAMMEKLQVELLTASIANMKADAANSRAITTAVVSQITGKAIKKAID